MPSSIASAAIPSDALFLGLDSSTQSLKATAVDAGLRVVAYESVNFDAELPHYATRGGVHRKDGRITAPVLMWVDALELLLRKLQRSDFPFDRVCALSGSGQQHGSVYWRKGALDSTLEQLDHRDSLAAQLKDAFSTHDCPVWMDSSTGEQCKAIEKALGGAAALAALTGSRAFERFTGPQIRRLYETLPEAYDNTERISLVSSFMASLLIGSYASIDHSDGAGMNLMDYKQRSWSDAALKVTAPGLLEKLGPLAPSHSVAGKIHPFFVTKFNFRSDCLVVHWSGDNPCTLAGLTLDEPGDIAISLGTSDTVFGITREPHPGVEGHVFPNPVDPSSFMAMLCYKNGSLTREAVRDRFAGGSWETFNSYIDRTPRLNGGKLVFYYKEPEILPPLPAGVHRFVVGEDDSVQQVRSEFQAAEEVRGVAEGHFASMRAHAERIGLPSPPARIIAAGGASANQQLLRLITDVFGCNVYKAQSSDAASVGAAFRAAHGWLCDKETKFVPISAMFKSNAAADSATHLQLAESCEQLPQQHTEYGRLASLRTRVEQLLLDRQQE